MCIYIHIHAVETQQMVSLRNLHYSTIYDMFRPYKWAIIRLLVEPKGRLYNKGWGGGGTRSRLTLPCGVVGC
jgi:hypothetical protein